MIGQLRGTVLSKQPPYLLLDVQGVGYEIAAPMTTFYHLPELNGSITLYTHLVVREDAHQLYGFHRLQDRDLFRTLIKINGVGPKLALTILSGIEPDHFIQCVRQGDTMSLTSIPGVGKKTAERLLMEARDLLQKWQPSESSSASTVFISQEVQDALSALTTLGYKPMDAKRIIERVQQPNMKSEQLIRLALQQMVTHE